MNEMSVTYLSNYTAMKMPSESVLFQQSLKVLPKLKRNTGAQNFKVTVVDKHKLMITFPVFLLQRMNLDSCLLQDFHCSFLN